MLLCYIVKESEGTRSIIKIVNTVFVQRSNWYWTAVFLVLVKSSVSRSWGICACPVLTRKILGGTHLQMQYISCTISLIVHKHYLSCTSLLMKPQIWFEVHMCVFQGRQGYWFNQDQCNANYNLGCWKRRILSHTLLSAQTIFIPLFLICMLSKTSGFLFIAVNLFWDSFF